MADSYGFSPEQLSNFRAHFKVLDVDGDGHISHLNLQQVCNRLGVRMTAVNIEQLIREVDNNNSGSVELDEFIRLMYRMKKGGSSNWKALLQATRPSAKNAAPLASHANDIEAAGVGSSSSSSARPTVSPFPLPTDSHPQAAEAVNFASSVDRAKHATLKFFGATASENNSENETQWNKVSFFERRDVLRPMQQQSPLRRSASKIVNKTVRKIKDKTPTTSTSFSELTNRVFGRSGSNTHSNKNDKNENNKNNKNKNNKNKNKNKEETVIEMNPADDFQIDDDDARSDSSFEYYSDSDSELEDENDQPATSPFASVSLANIVTPVPASTSSPSPPPAARSASPVSSSRVASPPSSSRVASPPPSSRVASPSPSSRVASPPPSSRVASPPPSSRVASPPPSSRIASPQQGRKRSTSVGQSQQQQRSGTPSNVAVSANERTSSPTTQNRQINAVSPPGHAVRASPPVSQSPTPSTRSGRPRSHSDANRMSLRPFRVPQQDSVLLPLDEHVIIHDIVSASRPLSYPNALATPSAPPAPNLMSPTHAAFQPSSPRAVSPPPSISAPQPSSARAMSPPILSSTPSSFAPSPIPPENFLAVPQNRFRREQAPSNNANNRGEVQYGVPDEPPPGYYDINPPMTEDQRRRYQQANPQPRSRNNQGSNLVRSQTNQSHGTLSRQQRNQNRPQRRQRSSGTLHRHSSSNILYDPSVRAQLLKIKPHEPYFMMLLCLGFCVYMAIPIIYHHGLEPMGTNIMAGPSTTTLIQFGAKYALCARDPYPNELSKMGLINSTSPYPCPPTATTTNCTIFDTLNYVCSSDVTGPMGLIPNQWWRFITPIFLHQGIIHLVIMVIMHIWIGFRIERDMGSIRTALIWLISGVFGNSCAMLLTPLTVTMGSDTPMYGLIALLYLDLFQNWPLLVSPWKNFFFLSVLFILAFAIGFLPFIDNFAHIGGFIGGIFSGLIFAPMITFGKWDGRRKVLLLLLSLPILGGLYFGVFWSFYHIPQASNCQACAYLNCAPVGTTWCEGFLG